MSSRQYAVAKDFEEIPVYYPEVRPGYAGWANLFEFGNGDLGCTFNEIRRAKNPDFRPMSLEWYAAMNLPYQFGGSLADGNPDFVAEYVCLKSEDEGRTWTETGRSITHTRHYWYVGFPDGRLVRIFGMGHMGWPGDDRYWTVAEESRDGGTTWNEIARFLEGKCINMLKVKRLSDNSIVMAGPIKLGFGSGRSKRSRHMILPGQIHRVDGAFLVSRDGGHTWDGPHYVFPGVHADEFDFVELPGGDLLFINSQVQEGRAVRQIVRKTPTGWVNEPMMEIHRGATPNPLDWDSSFVPETVCITPDGLLVGALRCRPFACSNDLGENWYEIDGLPPSRYQPMMLCLPDGRCINVGHTGHDHHFGEIDMVLSLYSFRLDVSLPNPTALTLDRVMRPDGNRFINAYDATLTSAGRPLPDREIELRVTHHWTAEGRVNPLDVRDSTDVRTGVTDENGVARFVLSDMDAHADVHHTYHVAASFSPAPGDDCAPCLGPKRREYTLTSLRNCPTACPVYTVHGWIMISPETAERFPELADTVEKLDKHAPGTTMNDWIESIGSAERAGEIVDFLSEHRILSRNEDGSFSWYRAVHTDGDVVKGVRVSLVQEYYV